MAMAELVETILGLDYASLGPGFSMNPVSPQHADLLVQNLAVKLEEAPVWLRGAPEALSIAGRNSLFRVVCDVKDSLADPGGWDARRDPVSTSFGGGDVGVALAACVGKTDEELRHLVAFPNADKPDLLVPKLCLLRAVMTHTAIQRIVNIDAVGSCAGLLVHASFWGGGE